MSLKIAKNHRKSNFERKDERASHRACPRRKQVEGLEQRAMMTVFGSFEVDDDLVVSEGAADWASVGKVAIAYDLYNSASDPSFGSGVTEDTINPPPPWAPSRRTRVS
jgi:hypothetical protein